MTKTIVVVLALGGLWSAACGSRPTARPFSVECAFDDSAGPKRIAFRVAGASVARVQKVPDAFQVWVPSERGDAVIDGDISTFRFAGESGSPVVTFTIQRITGQTATTYSAGWPVAKRIERNDPVGQCKVG